MASDTKMAKTSVGRRLYRAHSRRMHVTVHDRKQLSGLFFLLDFIFRSQKEY